MNVKVVRCICLFLILLTLIGTATACKSKENVPSGQTSDVTLPPVEPDAPSEQEAYRPEKEDLDNYTFRMVIDDAGLQVNQRWFTYIEDDGMDVLDQAFYDRNMFLQDYFNINIEFKRIGTYQMVETMRKSLMSHDDFADITMSVAGHVLKPAATEGLAMDLNKLSPLNLDASYWDQRIQQEYSINNMLFTLEGDYNCYDDLSTYVVYFNNYLYEQFDYPDKYGSLYDHVRDGTWTQSLLMEMVKGVAEEDNSNIAPGKRWGMYAQDPLPYIYYLATGNHGLVHEEDGSLSLVFDDRTVYNITETLLSDAIKAVAINEDVVVIESCVNAGTATWPDFFEGFATDKAMFYTGIMVDFQYFSKDMKSLYGMLPIPKYNSEQEEYYSWCSSQCHLPLVIPKTAYDHAETTAKITEAMAYFSKYPFSSKGMTVVEAEYEWLMLNSVCRTYDDLDMAKIVFASKAYDLDFATNLTGITWLTQEHCRSGSLDRFSSNLRGIQSKALGQLTEFLRDVKDNNLSD